MRDPRPDVTAGINRRAGVADENQIVITGAVCKAPETRHSPAGVALTRFTVEHRARRIVNGVSRETRFRIVVAAAAELGRSAAVLRSGDRVRIHGYLSRSDIRMDERHITLHAESIERLQEPLQQQ